MVNFKVRNKALIVSVTGDIDQHNASLIREQTDLRISHENVKKVIFDFSALDFMDSSGIGLVIGRYKLVSAIGGNVYIVVKKPTLKRLFELSGVKKIAVMCDSLAQAMSA